MLLGGNWVMFFCLFVLVFFLFSFFFFYCFEGFWYKYKLYFQVGVRCSTVAKMWLNNIPLLVDLFYYLITLYTICGPKHLMK